MPPRRGEQKRERREGKGECEGGAREEGGREKREERREEGIAGWGRYGTRKWREGQLEGGKIYLRTTGVRIVRGRSVSSA